MTYDDASWHDDSAVEHGLDPACGATHIGMFFAWLAAHGMVDADFTDVGALVHRTVTPGRFLLTRCAGEIDPFMLTTAGTTFAEAAYGPYVKIYQRIPAVARYSPSFAAPDGWELYDAVADAIDDAYRVFTGRTSQFSPYSRTLGGDGNGRQADRGRWRAKGPSPGGQFEPAAARWHVVETRSIRQ
jgi:hypothetical protein